MFCINCFENFLFVCVVIKWEFVCFRIYLGWYILGFLSDEYLGVINSVFVEFCGVVEGF